MDSIGKRFKEIRIKQNLKQEDFAKQLDKTQKDISCYENDKVGIPDETKIKLLKKGININWLLTGEGEMFMGEEKHEIKPEREPEPEEKRAEVIPAPSNYTTYRRRPSEDTLPEVITWLDKYPGCATLSSNIKACIIREEQEAINKRIETGAELEEPKKNGTKKIM